MAVLNDVLLEALEETDIDLGETLQGGSNRKRTQRPCLPSMELNWPFPTMSVACNCARMRPNSRQIMGNLIKNALQHRSRHLGIGMACRDERLVIEVIDDGPGIGRDHRELIFERYKRVGNVAALSRSGHGLGPGRRAGYWRVIWEAISRVRNGCDSGAIFCLLLPMALER